MQYNLHHILYLHVTDICIILGFQMFQQFFCSFSMASATLDVPPMNNEVKSREHNLATIKINEPYVENSFYVIFLISF